MTITTERTAMLPWDVQTVWQVVTGVEGYPAWRRDLLRAEILNEKQFLEHTPGGIQTLCTVTAAEPCRRWAFDLENPNLTGHWMGRFTAQGAGTQVTFRETVTLKKVIPRPLVWGYLKRQQARFLADLERALAQEGNGGGKP